MLFRSGGNLHEGAIYKDRDRSVVRLEKVDDDFCEYLVIREPHSGERPNIQLTCRKEFFWNAFVLLADCENDWLSIEENDAQELRGP